MISRNATITVTAAPRLVSISETTAIATNLFERRPLWKVKGGPFTVLQKWKKKQE